MATTRRELLEKTALAAADTGSDSQRGTDGDGMTFEITGPFSTS